MTTQQEKSRWNCYRVSSLEVSFTLADHTGFRSDREGNRQFALFAACKVALQCPSRFAGDKATSQLPQQAAISDFNKIPYFLPVSH